MSATAGDFTIRCGENEHKTDSVVMRLHSDVLAKACEGGFKVSHCLVASGHVPAYKRSRSLESGALT